MKSLQSTLTCCLVVACLAPLDGEAFRKREPTGYVTVSKPASTMPGRRYAWVEMPAQKAVEFDERAKDPELRLRLEAALDKALQAKGYARTERMREADLAVAYRVGVRDVQQSMAHEGPAGAGESAIRCSGGDCSQIVTEGADGLPSFTVQTQDMIQGGLMVEVLKPNEIRVLWRALYRGSIRARDRGTVDLDAVAVKTLAKLPKAPATAP
ncbi:DUF4136 domain-containing protein [Agrilutibacter solisilvae]|uniref:DUF4136 domain-containing protein n=1 Tax=Agrilutibacter solisilvae TaxID=2763317 RepID=A0A974Y267_9GAMM|nr:DUF4136 domain-containing protein [Lysobacter solisilvae]QSX79035.1 DUF4136 domain-containing protein [Lysobacter solisilvae]